LKKIYRTNFVEFADLCKQYGINSSVNRTSPPSSIKIQPTKTRTNQAMSVSSSSSSSPFRKLLPQAMRHHQCCLNFAFPSLNNFGMMWFRDDDVEIGDSMCSILTIYQPLFDARDQDLIRLSIDSDDPTVLHHSHPTVPTFMFKDFKKVHQLEGSEENPEIYSETRKKHKKHAFKIANNKNLKLQSAEYSLPFALSMDSFDGIINSTAEIKKHYRYFNTVVDTSGDEEIEHTCAYIFWKVLIEGETTNCSTKAQEERNVYSDAHKRMSRAFADMDMDDENSADADFE
jgi:hypothetical protein